MPRNPEREPKVSRGRRKFVATGAVAGGLTIIAPRKSLAQRNPPTPTEPELCLGDELENSPPTRPFRQAMPIPAAARPTTLNPAPQQNANIAAGEAPRAPHQRWNEFLPNPNQRYELTARPAFWRFHPDLPPSYIWGFNGVTPGPTILSRYDQPAIVRFRNGLPEEFDSYGIPEITVHLHNGHTPSESDGFAGDFYGPGLWKDNHYPNVLAGYDAFRATRGDWREAQYTYWYHDHRAMFTAQNNYRGLQGMYWLFDQRDSGNETDTNPLALRLPSGYGRFDIPMVFTDKLFCENGALFAEPDAVFQGDKWGVNGAIQPFFQVRRRKYRFRLLNPGPDRTWIHQLWSDRRGQLPITVIATDGNLLERPITVDEIVHSVAERYDVIVDFSQARDGERIYWVNANEEDDPQFVGFPSPTPLPAGVEIEQVVMRIDVLPGLVADPSRVPAVLTQYPPLTNPVRTKEWNFTRNDTDPEASVFEINGRTFDAARSDHQARRNTSEIWVLRNQVPESEWVHPVHIHFEEFRVLSRNGAPPDPLESGRKDVIRLPPGDEIRLFMQFRDFTGRYLIHCHNMNHEDIFMMVRWDIV